MIRAVIGAQFGDEGKGLVTDYLANHQSLVVRFNGGAQAGHTVVLPDGRRHEFHHFGAGCYKAACTLLSRHFIVNPIAFRLEHEAPELQGIRRTVYVDPRARVTTPFDMMLNVAIEQARGDRRHGSCGFGINETVTRNGHADFALTVGDLARADVEARLANIREDWVRFRAAQLDIPPPESVWQVGLLDAWMTDVRFFIRNVAIVPDVKLIADQPDLVFEGAQGLRLDEERGTFPHVTRSRTGLTNVIALLSEARRIDPVEAIYVTRCYTTRHGAGRLQNETAGHPYGWTGPETNVTNEHQGAFRYGPFDNAGFEDAVQDDLRRAVATHDVDGSVFVTCLDQTRGQWHDEVAREVASDVRLDLLGASYGPTRADVRARIEAEA